MPSVVKRNTSLTIRHRLTPAITCSTTTRILEKSRLQNFPLPLALSLWAFFGLRGQYTARLIALKAGVFVERGVRAVGNRSLIHRLLVVRLARQCRPQIDDFVRVFVDQKDVFVGMRLFLAAVMFLLRGGVSWALAATFGAIHRQVGGPCQGQGARLDTLRIALRGLAHRTQGVLQNGQ